MAKNIRKKKSDNKGKKGSEKQENKNTGKDTNKGDAADFWDRVSDDVASGYVVKEKDNTILNEDQLPDDGERGDKAEYKKE
jgi:hypothetical protein